MTDIILASTRKGLFCLERDGAVWDVRRTAFLGESVSLAYHDPVSGRLYAALKLGHFGAKLHASDDLGRSWQEVTCPAFPPEDKEGGPSVLEIWSLATGRAGRLWAGTIGGGLFWSDDGAESWALAETLWRQPARANWFGGGNDAPALHSICVDPRDANRLALAVSCGGVWQSADSGGSWRSTSRGMYAEFMPPERREDPDIQDVHCLVQCRARPERFWAQHHNGVFRSSDGGESWQEVTAISPSKFGFAVAVHPADPDRAWFVPAVKDECRIPVEGALVVSRTGDGGKSFEILREGLPQRHAYDLVLRHALAIDDAGERLAMGSTSGHLWLSDDQGDHWQLAAGHLPPIHALAFSRALASN
jgi:hypothetical protein